MVAEQEKKLLDIDAGDVAAEAIAKNVLKNKDESDQKKRDEPKRGGGKPVKFGKGVEIYPDRPLEHLNTPMTQAFEAASPANPAKRLYAVICNDVMSARKRTFKLFDALNNKCMAELIDFGSAYWSPEDRHRYILIFDNIYGAPAMPNLKGKQDPMGEDMIIRMVVKPIASLLRAFKERGIVHGGIRPNMLYENLLDGGKSYALAPSLGAPYGFEQPVLFETVERAMCQPSGRGSGDIGHDLYALGVTLALLMIGYNPLVKRTDAEIVRAKLEYGSFSTLLGNQRLPQGLNEVFRGLLADDPKMRWTLDDLEKWTEGRRASPRQGGSEPKAARAYEFGDDKFTNLRLLSKVMSENPIETIKHVENGLLKRWIERSLGDRLIAERYDAAVDSYIPGDTKDQGRIENIVSKLCMALDPRAPIRYRGVAVMPDGLGVALTEAMAAQKNIDVLTEILQNDLIPFWFSCQTEAIPDMVSITGSLEATKNFLRQKVPGNGIERCVYYLNREANCFSPMFKAHCVHDADTFIRALEDIAARQDRPKEPFDQHMAAFLAVHFSGSNEGDIQLLGAYDLKVKYGAMLILLSSLQSYASISKMPNLAKWMMTMIEPVVNNFNSRDLRKKINADLEQIASNGDLVGMRALLENESILKEDVIGFSKAKLEFKRLNDEYMKLDADLSREGMGLVQGREMAAIVSAVLAVMGLFGFLVTRYGSF